MAIELDLQLFSVIGHWSPSTWLERSMTEIFARQRIPASVADPHSLEQKDVQVIIAGWGPDQRPVTRPGTGVSYWLSGADGMAGSAEEMLARILVNSSPRAHR